MGQQLSATEHRFNAMSVETNQKLDLLLSLLPSSLLEQWSPAAATASGYGKRVGSRGSRACLKFSDITKVNSWVITLRDCLSAGGRHV